LFLEKRRRPDEIAHGNLTQKSGRDNGRDRPRPVGGSSMTNRSARAENRFIYVMLAIISIVIAVAVYYYATN
jgi:hypothetical protein